MAGATLTGSSGISQFVSNRKAIGSDGSRRHRAAYGTYKGADQLACNAASEYWVNRRVQLDHIDGLQWSAARLASFRLREPLTLSMMSVGRAWMSRRNADRSDDNVICTVTVPLANAGESACFAHAQNVK